MTSSVQANAQFFSVLLVLGFIALVMSIDLGCACKEGSRLTLVDCTPPAALDTPQSYVAEMLVIDGPIRTGTVLRRGVAFFASTDGKPTSKLITAAHIILPRSEANLRGLKLLENLSYAIKLPGGTLLAAEKPVVAGCWLDGQEAIGDYAIVTLNGATNASSLPLAIPPLSDGVPFPGNIAVFRKSLRHHEGCITKVSGLPILIYSKAQFHCLPGESGSPIVGIVNNSPVLLGLHTDTDQFSDDPNHSGVYVTQPLINLFNNPVQDTTCTGP